MLFEDARKSMNRIYL